MSDRHALQTFLRTDLHRLEAALEERVWTPALAERLTHHLRFAAQLQAAYLEGGQADEQPLAALAPQNVDEVITLVEARIEALVAAIEAAPDARLHAPVLDAHERGLTVAGHLYDFCRATALLIGWLEGLAVGEEQGDEWVGWEEGD